MKILFQLPGSDSIQERAFSFLDWKQPLPRKGESIKLYATYLGDQAGLKLVSKGPFTLCHFHVTRVTYEEDTDHVEIGLTFTVPVLRD